MEAPVYASSQPSSSSYYEDSENDEGPLIEDKPKEEPIQIDQNMLQDSKDEVKEVKPKKPVDTGPKPKMIHIRGKAF